MRKVAGLVVGCVFFGVAMACRECFDSIWARAGVAAVGAGGGLVFAFLVAGNIFCNQHKAATDKGTAQ
jgi:hypothetical protein